MNNGIVVQDNYNELFVNNSLPLNGIGKNSNIDGINGPNFGLYDPNNIVLVFDTSKEPANLQVSVPLGGSGVDCIIFWGDGTSETHTTTGFKTHVYEKPGIYIVQVGGTMRTLSFGSGASTTDNKLKLVRCLSFGETGLTSLSSGFRNCPNLIQCPNKLPSDSKVTDISDLFNGCTLFNDASLSSWDTSSISSMFRTFLLAISFNQPLNNWNTSAVTNMANMFQNATSFDQPLNNWNTSAVTNMQFMFVGTRFNQNIESWNTALVTTMSNMFNNCQLFNQPLNNWNTSAVTDISNMFASATSFDQPLDNWNTASVTNMANVFFTCSSFNQPLNNWNTSAVTTMASMFRNANAFNQPLNNWNTSSVTNMDDMFGRTIGNPSFSQDISNWDIRKVTNMTNMFNTNAWGTANYDAALTAWADLADDDLRTQTITSFATLSGGTQTRVTSNNHGMVAGSRVNISGTTNYDGDYNVLAAATNTFDIAKAFVANDATGTMKHRRSRNVVAGFGTNKYSIGTPTTKRGVLTGTYLWTITDGGQA